MTTLADFAISKRWPPMNPDHIQLYSLTTPNGVKASIMLEESGLPYDAHLVNIMQGDQMAPEFLEISPNNKIPAMIDPNGPGGGALSLFESGAILIYLADKSGKFLSSDPTTRYETLQWLMFQMAGIGPMFGQLGFFTKFAGKEIEDPRPSQRFIDESKRLLGVLDNRLEGRDYVMAEYSIADIAIFPWLNTMINFYKAGELVDWENFKNAPAYLERCLARPAVQRGMINPPLP